MKKLSLFICGLVLFCHVQSAICDLSVETGSVSNLTRTTAISYGSLTGTNGSTNSISVSVVLYYGQSDGYTNAADWSFSMTNTFTDPSLPLSVTNSLSSLTPAWHYYCRYYVIQDTNAVWSAAGTNFFTVAGTPTNAAPQVHYTPVMVNSNGVIVSPTNVPAANGLARTNDVASLQSQISSNSADISVLETNTATAAQGVAATNAQARVAILETNTATLAQGTLASNWGSNSNNVFWLDGRYAGDRSAWGKSGDTGKLSINDIADTSIGASQHGWNYGNSVQILGNSRGAEQRGFWYAGGTCFSTITDSPAAGQYLSLMGYNQSVTIGPEADGAVQRGFFSADAVIGYRAYGAMMLGTFVSYASTNGGAGSIMLEDGWNGGGTITENGSASILLGAGTVSNRCSIVAGDGQVSHGEASITAGGGFFGSGTGLTGVLLYVNPPASNTAAGAIGQCAWTNYSGTNWFFYYDPNGLGVGTSAWVRIQGGASW